MSQPGQPSARWALLIGIDSYPKLSADEQLSGCVNDVTAMARILVDRFGFPCDNVTTLVDRAATRAAILDAMEGLVAKARPGDAVVFHYAGHGSQAPSIEPDEADGLDETIMPHDTSHRGDSPNLDIHDKEVADWLERLTAATSNVTLIFDSCHSGGVTRDASGVKARWVAPDRRPLDRRLVPPLARTGRRQRGEPGPSGWLPLGQRYALLAGCASSECSYELAAPGGDGLQHGALSYALSRQLAAAAAGTTYRDVFEAAAVQVTANCSLQHPQLEGAADRVLFGLDQIEPMRFVPVSERRGNEVVLEAGLAMGLSRGSTWSIYPASTKLVTPGMPALGTVELAAVRGVSSSGRVTAEASPGAISPGSRAIELSHDYGIFKLAVRIAAPVADEASRGALAAAVESSALLRPACEGEKAAATAYLLPPRQHAGPDDPVPQAGPRDAPVWAVVGGGGEIILPLCQPGPDAAARLAENLEKHARYLTTLAIHNPTTRLGGAIDCVLLRRHGDAWVAAAAEPGGLPLYTAGEQLAFELVNRSSRPLYFYVLDLGLTGRIGPLYPFAGIDEPLRERSSLRIGTRPRDQMDLSIPDDFPFLPPTSPAEVTGKETLKVFATERPTDFRWRFQGVFRGERGPLSSLDRLLGLAAGERRRDASSRILSQPEEDDWTAIERSFWLQPPRWELPAGASSPAETLRFPG